MRLSKTLSSPAAGPIATTAALLMAGALAASWSLGARREADLRGQVEALAARNQQTAMFWKTQLSSCRAEAAATARPEGLTRVAQSDSGDAAARLASVGPAGFDVCARMEAADQAVLASLNSK